MPGSTISTISSKAPIADHNRLADNRRQKPTSYPPLYYSRMRIPAFHVRRFPAIALLIGFGLVAQTPPPPIDNDQVRVIKALDQPHKKGALHEHKLNRVMIYLQAG